MDFAVEVNRSSAAGDVALPRRADGYKATVSIIDLSQKSVARVKLPKCGAGLGDDVP